MNLKMYWEDGLFLDLLVKLFLLLLNRLLNQNLI